MATGDPRGNLAGLARELRSVRYSAPLDEGGLLRGEPRATLPVLHYVLLGFSRHVARAIAAAGFELLGASDARFVDGALRVLRELFGYRAALAPAQVLAAGFAERKMLLLRDAVGLAKRRHNELVRKGRLAAQQHAAGEVPRVASLAQRQQLAQRAPQQRDDRGERSRSAQSARTRRPASAAAAVVAAPPRAARSARTAQSAREREAPAAGAYVASEYSRAETTASFADDAIDLGAMGDVEMPTLKFFGGRVALGAAEQPEGATAAVAPMLQVQSHWPPQAPASEAGAAMNGAPSTGAGAGVSRVQLVNESQSAVAVGEASVPAPTMRQGMHFWAAQRAGALRTSGGRAEQASHALDPREARSGAIPTAALVRSDRSTMSSYANHADENQHVVAASASTLAASAMSVGALGASAGEARAHTQTHAQAHAHSSSLADQLVAFQAAEVQRAGRTAGGAEVHGTPQLSQPPQPSPQAQQLPPAETKDDGDFEFDLQPAKGARAGQSAHVVESGVASSGNDGGAALRRQLSEQAERIAFLEEMLGSMQAAQQSKRAAASQRSSQTTSGEAAAGGASAALAAMSDAMSALAERVEGLAAKSERAAEEAAARMTVMEGRMRFAETELTRVGHVAKQAARESVSASIERDHASMHARDQGRFGAEDDHVGVLAGMAALSVSASGGGAGASGASAGFAALSSSARSLSARPTEDFISSVTQRFAAAQELLDRTRV